jgi:hypothetical protein
MIEGKLRAISSDEQEQFILISALRNQIHGMASADMGNAITTWAQTISVDRAKEGRDLRSATERELQERVSQWKSDPSFNEPLGEVLRMLPYAARRDAASIYVIHGNYSSVLFKRVFKDPRGPVNAINAIRNILVTLNENQRYQAIWNWDPTQ